MEQEILQCIARNLKYLRLCCGYSQDDLAKYLHLSRTSYGAVEKGIRTPQTDLIVDLAKLYRIRLDVLFEADKEAFVREVTLMKGDADKADFINLYYRLSPFSQGRLFEKAIMLLETENREEVKEACG